MDEIEKLFRKISKNDRLKLEETVEKILSRNFENLRGKKLQQHRFLYRVRVGNYRIIYFDDGKVVVLKAIKKRNESTYNDF